MFSRTAETCTRPTGAEQCDVCAWDGLEVVYWSRRPAPTCFLKLGEPRDLRSSKTSVCSV